MDLTNVKNTFIWAWMLAGVCVSVIAAGPGLDAQNYTNHPYIVSPESVRYGSDVNLTCYILIKVRFITSISFTWKRNGERFTNGGNYEMSSGSGSFVNSIYKYYTNTLTVKDTSMTDEGKRYMCQVEVAVGSWSSSFNTEEYILGQEVPSTTTTTAHEGENVTIFLSWRVTDNVMWLWSPGGELIATIQSISVYMWPNSRSKVKVTRLMTLTYSKTVELVIYNATKGDAGPYYLSDFKRKYIHGGHNLVVADRSSTTVTTVSSTVGRTTLQTTTPVSITSASTQDASPYTVTVSKYTETSTTTGIVLSTTTTTYTDQIASPNTVIVTSKHIETSTTTGIPLSTATAVNTDQNVTTVILYIIDGCCLLLIVLAVVIGAAIVLIRIKQLDVHQRKTPSISTTADIVQRYDVVDCSPVGSTEDSQLHAANSLGYHTLNFKRFNRLNEFGPSDAHRLVPLDHGYEPVTLTDHGPVLNSTQQFSDHEEEDNNSVSLCSLNDHGQREKDSCGYAQCIVVVGNVPTISFE